MTTDNEQGDRAPARVRQLPTWVLSRAHVRAHRILSAGFEPTGLRGSDYRLLAALEEFGPQSQAALGRSTGIDRSDVVASLNGLVSDGYVKRSPDPADGRRNVITLTAAGRRTLAQLDAVVTDVQEQVLAPLTRAERRQLLHLLGRLAD